MTYLHGARVYEPRTSDSGRRRTRVDDPVNDVITRQRVCAIVVIRDRETFPERLLATLSGLARPPDDILVLTRSDGPRPAADASSATVLTLDAGEGPAGGFYAGIKHAYGSGFDWFWLLHDDVTPDPEALEKLLEASAAVPGLPAPYLLASKVLGRDGRLDPEHAPFPDTKRVPHAVLAVSGGLVPVRSADFTSVLVSRTAVRHHGLPIRGYFDCGYELEYAARLLREGIGYAVPQSVVRHDRDPGAGTRERADGVYYDVRNTVFMLKGNAWMGREKVQLLIDLLPRMRLRGSVVEHAAMVARGVADGVRRSPESGGGLRHAVSDAAEDRPDVARVEAVENEV